MTELDDDVHRRLLDAYRSKGPTEGQRDRVFAALSGAIATGVTVPSAAAVTAASKGGFKAFALSHPLVMSGVGLGVGCAVAFGVWLARAPAPRSVPPLCPAPCASAQPSTNTASPGPVPSDATTNDAPAPPLNPTPSVEVAPPAPRPSAPKRPTTHGSDLAAEAALLHRAHSAYRRGQPAETLTLLQEHALKYPSSQLSVERGTLKVLALCALNRIDEARRTAANLPPRSTALRGTCAER